MTGPTKWRRTQFADPDAPRIMAEDWTLVDVETGEALARIYDTGTPDILGSWRWEVAPYYRIANQGTDLIGTDARTNAEARIAEAGGVDD